MGVVGLIAGLLLPWLVGGLLFYRLMASRGEGGGPGAWAASMGLGFFLGYGLLILLLPIGYSALGHQVSGVWLPILFVAALFAFERTSALQIPSSGLFSFRSRRDGLFLIPLVAMLLHLSWMGYLSLSNPILPWDAWSTWAYRAKVWYLSGGLVPFVASGEWENGGYALAAHDYPAFVSLVYLWSALTFGGWDESWLGLPWLCCWIALAMASYGMARQMGANRTGAMILAYLLVSIPMFDVHAGLQGYADLWLAGYAGLGVAVMLCGISLRRHLHTVAGGALLVMGTMVKPEGAVWLGLGLLALLIGLAANRRGVWVGVMPLVAGVAGLLMAGVVVGLPGGLGSWGRDGNTLFLGAVAALQLEYHPVVGSLLRNMFGQGSWHLYWLLPPILVVMALADFRSPVSRALLLLGLGYSVMVIGLFLFTEHGRWMADETAFNRVAMHLAPAILLAFLHLQPTRRWLGAE